MPKKNEKKSEYGSISIDIQTKEAAEKKVEKEGYTLSGVTRMLLQEYINGNLKIGIIKTDSD